MTEKATICAVSGPAGQCTRVARNQTAATALGEPADTIPTCNYHHQPVLDYWATQAAGGQPVVPIPPSPPETP